MIWEFIAAEKANFPIVFMCAEFKVSRQGYYAWERRAAGGGSRRAVANAELTDRIRAIFARRRGRYGSPRIRAELAADGIHVAAKRVARLMAEAGLVARCGRRRTTTRTTQADPAAVPAPNVLDRQFDQAVPDAAWVTDVTYIWTDEGFVYLAAIIDCCTRMVVGWSTADHLRTELCTAALEDAVAKHRPGPGLIHHSDRGCQYTSHDYRRALTDLKFVQSMSRKGNCWDNAVAESFFSTLKLELIYEQDWTGKAELDAALFEYIEVFYNRERLHSTLDYSTPDGYRDAHKRGIAA
ncbi:MAG: IS3 family transposase [Actinobacteria bacterium]|nr:IS3 family transposase [Actinomycetota bacterium]